MKNKVLIGSLITTLLAFMLYSVNIKRVENSQVQIVNQKNTTNKSKGKTAHEPKMAAVEYPNHIKVASGSNQDWSKQIEKVMGKDQSYQVSVQDLNSGKFARVSNTAKAHEVGATGNLFLLAAIYYQEQHGKLSDHTAIKVKKADRAKGDKMLKPGIAYGVTFLKQTLMRKNKTAGNALTRKVKPAKINEVAHKMGATNTKFGEHYSAGPVATTTAADLAAVMNNLYQNKTLNRQYANMALGSLSLTGKKPKIVAQTNGATIYAIGDSRANVALVQSHGHAYCVSVWARSDRSFSNLGKTVNGFFK